MYPLTDQLPFHLNRLLPHAGPYLVAFMNSLIGLVLGGGPLLAIGWVWEKLRHIEAMGGGDVKLMGMVGSFLGWKGALLTIMLGAVVGSVVGVLLILLKRHKMEKVIPFGPFLALGAVTAAFYGTDIISWYLSMIAYDPPNFTDIVTCSSDNHIRVLCTLERNATFSERIWQNTEKHQKITDTTFIINAFQDVTRQLKKTKKSFSGSRQLLNIVPRTLKATMKIFFNALRVE